MTGAAARRAPGAAVAVFGLAVLACVAVLGQPAGVLLFLAYAGTGLVLAVRRPGQPIAWLLVLTGVGFALGNLRIAAIAVLAAGRPQPLDAFTAWANGMGWSLAFVGLTGLALVFPSGSLPARGRKAAVAIMVASVSGACLIALGPTINVTPVGADFGTDVPNPITLLPGSAAGPGFPTSDTLYTALFITFLVAVVGLLARFRQSRGLERLQYRWLAWAGVVVVVVNGIWAIIALGLRLDQAGLAWAVAIASYTCIPVAVAIAVLRYRLYEIDRLVSRTVGWALATAAVIGMFVLGVLAFQALLSGVTQDQALAVAASTLLAVALFQPLRTRLQGLVDRRFDRPRIQAERTLHAHGEQLRHEVDLDTIRLGVVETVVVTLRPAAAGVWIRGRGGRGASGGRS